LAAHRIDTFFGFVFALHQQRIVSFLFGRFRLVWPRGGNILNSFSVFRLAFVLGFGDFRSCFRHFAFRFVFSFSALCSICLRASALTNVAPISLGGRHFVFAARASVYGFGFEAFKRLVVLITYFRWVVGICVRCPSFGLRFWLRGEYLVVLTFYLPGGRQVD